MDSSNPTLTQQKIDECFEYLDNGWSIIPIAVDTKKPLVKWKAFQSRQATEEEVTEWFTRWPKALMALVTGDVSDIYVVDMDTPEAEQKADELGFVSPVQVRTPHGSHRYFRHPGDGQWRGPQSGSGSNGTVWPQVDGLDWRGDGSYALLPTCDNHYHWHVAEGFAFEDMPTWQDRAGEPEGTDVVPMPEYISGTLIHLDLSKISTDNAKDIWKETSARANTFPGGKIPRGGSGIYNMTFRYLGRAVLEVGIGEALEAAGREYMDAFFTAPLEEARLQQNLASIRRMEKLNHPERFDNDDHYIGHLSPDRVIGVAKVAARHYITDDDAEQLRKEVGEQAFLVRPIIRKGSIVQVAGYSGHGKSLFTYLLMCHLARGKRFGCFEIGQPQKVLYFDFENGRGTLANLLASMRRSWGPDRAGNLTIWTPFRNPEREINLKTADGMRELACCVKEVEPDVVVIDTIRSAFPGLKENSAEEWRELNGIALKLRNAGYTVVFLHHTNKPTESGIAREAGSTNQLTTLETQIKIVQVFRDKEEAKNLAGIWDGAYDNDSPWHGLERISPRGGLLQVVLEVQLGKVREWTEDHERKQFFGIGENADGKRFVIASMSPKEKARHLAGHGMDVKAIAAEMRRSLAAVTQWLDA
ncbi:hypothetical protein GCM10023116_48440 [Kistimonas scapharcae]|uniref:DNA primase/polymerase bifunctional N-terminal domain-containing protein n=1 Tax=Kistimonas scapharcae TaxID=1036133 RepID=A0ABP8V975_9GAMM